MQLLNAYELPYFILEFQYEIVPLEDGTLYVPVFLQLNLIKFAVNYATEYATEYFLSKISGLKKVSAAVSATLVTGVVSSEGFANDAHYQLLRRPCQCHNKVPEPAQTR